MSIYTYRVYIYIYIRAFAAVLPARLHLEAYRIEQSARKRQASKSSGARRPNSRGDPRPS